MEIKDGDEVHYAHCRACGVICISNDPVKCNERAFEHSGARGPEHGSTWSSIGFTAVPAPNYLVGRGSEFAITTKKPLVICSGPGCTFGTGGVNHGPTCPVGSQG